MAQLFRDEKANVVLNKSRSNFVFFAYPFLPALPRADYDNVVKTLQDEIPFRIWYFADEFTTDELMRKIWRAILRADLALFDVSDGNANVSLELGLALAAEKHCFTLLKEGANNPLGRADMSFAERINYTSSVELKLNLRQAIMRHTSCGRMMSQVADQLYGGSGFLKPDLEARIVSL